MINRGPLIASVSAGVALVVATAAVIVVLARSGGGDDGPRGAAYVIDDGHAAAADIAQLRHGKPTIDAGQGPGVVIRGGVPGLGILPDDHVIAVAGVEVTSVGMLEVALSTASIARATTLYVELVRNGRPVLLRRTIDGDLHAAMAEARGRARIGVVPPADPADLSGNPYAAAVPDPDDPVAALVAGIHKRDDVTYEIDASARDKILADPAPMATGARVVPAIKNGKPDGFKLYAIRPSSIYAALGFNNGDTLQSINGFELTSADKALDAYTKLRDADQLEVDIVRRGVPMTLTYTIR